MSKALCVTFHVAPLACWRCGRVLTWRVQPCASWSCEQQSSYVNAQGITTVATSNLDGAMCGDDPEGLYVSIGQGIKDLDDRVTTWGSATRDGYVKIASCKVIKSSSSWSISSTYVLA